MKLLVGVFSVAFAVYTAIQSYMIAEAGVAYQVPQLEGDGGGGIVFTILCLATGLLALWKPFVSTWAFLFSSLAVLGIGIYYADTSMMLWSLGPIVLAAMSWYAHHAQRKKQTGATHSE